MYIEKAVFNCLEGNNGEYDELEDDFLMLANEGKPAIVCEDDTNELDDEYNNKGIVIVKDEFEERMVQMKNALL
jgi:hypothetical protein